MRDIVQFETRARRNVSFLVDSWTYKERLRRRREKDGLARTRRREAAERAERDRHEQNLREGFVEVGDNYRG